MKARNKECSRLHLCLRKTAVIMLRLLVAVMIFFLVCLITRRPAYAAEAEADGGSVPQEQTAAAAPDGPDPRDEPEPPTEPEGSPSSTGAPADTACPDSFSGELPGGIIRETAGSDEPMPDNIFFDAAIPDTEPETLIFPSEDVYPDPDSGLDPSDSLLFPDSPPGQPVTPEADPDYPQQPDQIFFPTPVPVPADQNAVPYENTVSTDQDQNTPAVLSALSSEASGLDTANDISGYPPVSGYQSGSPVVRIPLTRDQQLLSLRTGFQKCPGPVPAICCAQNWAGIYMGKTPRSRLAGRLYPGCLCYVLADENDPWVYVESGNVRGFVFSYYLLRGEEITAQVTSAGESSILLAQETADPLDNSVYRYSLFTMGEIPTAASALTGVVYSALSLTRKALLDYAASFAGYPYVWGGDDPHTGADCSGFVRYVYAQFGISLPRVAEDQAMVGQRISVSDALPGDLVFMMNDTDGIYHVVIYAGNGLTLEAKGRNYGIGSWPMDYSHAGWAVRLIDEPSYPEPGQAAAIPPVTGSPEENLVVIMDLS